LSRQFLDVDINTNGYRAVDATTNAARSLAKDICDAEGSLSKDVVAQGQAGQLATEKNGAAGQLATEKTGAASVLAVEKTAAASQLQTQLSFQNTQNLLISGFKDRPIRRGGQCGGHGPGGRDQHRGDPCGAG